MTNTTNTAAVETMRAAIGQLLNEFGERQWQSGRGVPHKSLEDAFEAIIERAALAAPAQLVLEPSREGQYAELPEHDATTVGLGCVWNRHSMRAFADATHALRASHGQAPAPGAPTDTPHAELRKTWREGQRWQTRGDPEWEWLDTTPCWWPDQEYRRHPDDFDAVAPAQAGEYPPLGKGSLWRDAEGIRGYGTDPGPGPWYTTEDVHKAINADRAASSVYSRSMDLVRVFWQQHTQADALSMTMAELHDDVELVIRAARGAAQAAPVDAAVLRDAERWMKLEAEAVRAYVGFNDIWYGSAEDLRHGVDQFPATYTDRAARERNK